MAERMAIGHDLGLFPDAAQLVISRRTWSGNPFRVINQNSIQRRVRVGWVKAGRLLLLLEDYGIVTRSGPARFDFAVEPDALEGKLAEIRAAHASEPLSAVCTGPDCGEQFADSETSEYLFATRERMERLLHADGWQVDPVRCPACQEEAGHDPLA